MSMTRKSVIGCVVLGLTAAGCNSKTKASPENYTAVLNAYYVEHQDCLLHDVKFPYEAGSGENGKEMEGLAKAKLVEGVQDPGLKVKRYTLTPAGERVGPRFCYGHRVVTAIDQSTPPALANGFQETQVNYTYKIEDMAVWAKTPEVLAAFPKMAEQTSGPSKGKATLALSGVGWSVPE